ncbi:NAD(P)-dependent dehydrogenase (short-subunit alcohol dehydrogenase family) [Actinocorallia herbida]|uniref:NAD(P)-dependent dehydrogenase (Short-subunit alcohol dehydrogenase family) n=1 Tax=Actinocorallia herbida TaxID=58109 RepID=A0A3N1D3A4_9ACTN|nr:glucose 1-dehydrogenase [Actinocorallia herbida]ROO88005.1 NAD(P)-dependent dehydrogenase (short-subunit alcohol dehydrogenase family) [Actinocorallia herbida]
MGLVEGKVALITGAGGVIGADTARLLAEEGARLVLTDLPTSRVAEIAAELTGQGHEAIALAGDITDEQTAITLVAGAVEAFGRLDVLDNNAGATYLSGSDGDLLGTTRELWDTSTSINVTAPMMLAKHAVPAMIASGGGSIVNISSAQSLRGDVRNTAYAAGKGALNALTRHIAVQYGPDGIRCNAIAPGLIVGEERLPSFPAPVREMFESNCSVQRLGRPRDISHAVLYLASDLSSYVTGQVLTVDGGITDQLATVGPTRAMALTAISTKG